MKKIVIIIYCLVLLAAMAVCGCAYATTEQAGRDMTYNTRIIN